MLTKIKVIGFAATMGLATAMSAFAQPNAGGQQVPDPIKNVTPFNDDDTYSVQVFFKFSCPVCREYHLSLANWGASLPKPFKIAFEPIVEADPLGDKISQESAMSMIMFWSVQDTGTSTQQAAFAEKAYSLVQDDHEGSKPTAWMSAVGQSGISRSTFELGFNMERKNLKNRITRQVHYMPTVTPSMVICGKWMISPDSTNGDENMFFQLANGLVSKCMIEHGIHKGS